MKNVKLSNQGPSLRWLLSLGLITQICIGLVLGVAVALLLPAATVYTKVLGDIFVGALKAIAPILVFVIVIASIVNQRMDLGNSRRLRNLMFIYIFGTILAAVFAVVATKLFPVDISSLLLDSKQHQTNVTSVGEVFSSLLSRLVENPINSLAQANYIGILIWGLGFGITLRFASAETKKVVTDISEAVSKLVRVVIRLAPIGIFGIVSHSIAEQGLTIIHTYGSLLALLLGTMLFFALVVNPIIVFFMTKQNPFPWVFYCLKESGIPAFFTRSSAANIPVNLAVAKRMGFAKELYSVALPLGSVISMVGAAIVITIFALVAAHSLQVQIDFLSAVLLSLVAALCAMGTSGIAGGSLLLIPVACSLLGIDAETAAKCISIGMVISVLQDSTETALNSSTDLLYLGAICFPQLEKPMNQIIREANKHIKEFE